MPIPLRPQSKGCGLKHILFRELCERMKLLHEIEKV